MVTRLQLLTPPAVAPVTVAEAREWLRIESDNTDHDAVLSLLIDTATAGLDGATGEIGRCLLAQVWRMTIDEFPAGAEAIELRLPPVMSIEALSYRDTSGNWQSLNGFQAVGLGSLSFAQVLPAAGTVWPATFGEPGSVKISAVCGFGDEASDVPADLRTLILARVATAFGIRESTWTGTAPARLMPEAAAVIDRYRVSEF